VSIFLNRGVNETLKNKSEEDKRLLNPLKEIAAKQGLPINILEDNNVSNEAEVRRYEGDL